MPVVANTPKTRFQRFRDWLWFDNPARKRARAQQAQISAFLNSKLYQSDGILKALITSHDHALVDLENQSLRAIYIRLKYIRRHEFPNRNVIHSQQQVQRYNSLSNDILLLENYASFTTYLKEYQNSKKDNNIHFRNTVLAAGLLVASIFFPLWGLLVVAAALILILNAIFLKVARQYVKSIEIDLVTTVNNINKQRKINSINNDIILDTINRIKSVIENIKITYAEDFARIPEIRRNDKIAKYGYVNVLAADFGNKMYGTLSLVFTYFPRLGSAVSDTATPEESYDPEYRITSPIINRGVS